LNTYFGINNERQDYEIGTGMVWVLVGEEKVNVGHEGEGI
jgi:hypothetical protein